MDDPPDKALDVSTSAPDEMFLLDRTSFLSLVELIHSTVPGVEVELQSSTVIRAQIRTRPPLLSPQPIKPHSSALKRAEEIYRFRRRRDLLIGHDLFADPAWDMLLDLYIARKKGRRVCISSACIAAATPATTALRWLKDLEGRGVIFREPDPDDARRYWLNLSPEMAATMDALLNQ